MSRLSLHLSEAKAPVAQAAAEPASTAPESAASLALITTNPYAYRAALAHRAIVDLVAVALALAVIGIALLYRNTLERYAGAALDRLRGNFRRRART